MNNIQVKAVMWKESIELRRSTLSYVIGTIIFVIVMQWMTSYQIISNTNLAQEVKEVLLGYSLMYLSLMCIPFLGTTLLTRILFEERKDSAIQIVLATGIKHRNLWLGKMLTTYLLTYGVFLCVTGIYFLIVQLGYGLTLTLDLNVFLSAFIVMPLLAMGFLSILGCLFWILKNPQLFGIVFPIVFVMGVWNFAMAYAEKYPSDVIVLVSLIFAVALNLLSFFVVSITKKAKVCDL